MSDVTSAASSNSFSEAAIFGRVVERSGKLSQELAEHILALGMTEDDQKRVETLLEKNSADSFSPTEREELDNLNHVADLLSLGHSQARRALRQS